MKVEPHQKPREKGIDLALGLDVIDLALADKMDVAVVFSSDTDLIEVARVAHQMTMRNGKRVSIEAAVFNDKPGPVVLRHYDFTHQLGKDDFDAARDSFNYTRELDPVWKDAFIKSCAAYRPLGTA